MASLGEAPRLAIGYRTTHRWCVRTGISKAVLALPPHLSNYPMVGQHHVECRFFTAMEQAAHDLFSGDPHKAGPNRSITVYHQAQCRPEDVEASHLSLMEEAGRRLAIRRT